MNFEKVYKEYLLFVSKRQKKQSFGVFQYNFSSNILSYFKDYTLEEIKTNDIIKWQEYILQKNFCNNHNKNLYAMLKNFLSYCSYKYNFDSSILYEIKGFQLKVENKHIDFYTLKEFNKFIKYVDDPIYKQFFILMFYTGCRPGEAMALKFSDLQGNYLNINKTIDEHGKREIGTPKSLSSNRLIYIDSKLKKELLKLKLLYIECTDNYFIFGGCKPLAPTTINRHKLKACELANIRPITLHQFRHSHATLLYNKGVDIHDISKRLGHSNSSITLNVYTHSTKEKRVIKTLNSARFNIFSVFQYNFKKY